MWKTYVLCVCRFYNREKKRKIIIIYLVFCVCVFHVSSKFIQQQESNLCLLLFFSSQHFFWSVLCFLLRRENNREKSSFFFCLFSYGHDTIIFVIYAQTNTHTRAMMTLVLPSNSVFKIVLRVTCVIATPVNSGGKCYAFACVCLSVSDKHVAKVFLSEHAVRGW